ncbi:unnamed protein product, partial [Meganyctiphanes norvegica]
EHTMNKQQQSPYPSSEHTMNKQQQSPYPSGEHTMNKQQQSPYPSGEHTMNKQQSPYPSGEHSMNKQQQSPYPSGEHSMNKQQQSPYPSGEHSMNQQQQSPYPSGENSTNKQQQSPYPSSENNMNKQQQSPYPSGEQHMNKQQQSPYPSGEHSLNQQQQSPYHGGEHSTSQQQQSPYHSGGGGTHHNSNMQSPYSNRQSPYSNQQSPYPPSVGGQSGPHSVPSPAPTTPQAKEKLKEKIEEKEVDEKKEMDSKDFSKEGVSKEVLSKDIDKKEVKDEKPEEKKEKDELSLDWTEGLFKEYVPGLLENSAKFQIFFKVLEGTLMALDRLLVFSQSLFTLTLLEEFLQRSYIPGTYEGWLRNRSYFRLDGSTSAQDREKLINEFNLNPSIRLFLVSTRAGSLGINLVGANRVVVFDASFNPCHDTQAVCRVYRYGQKKECHIYRLVTDNSLERRIYDRQINKQGIADRIVDEMNPDAHLSSKEISNLLVEGEEDPEHDETITEKSDDYKDDILKVVVKNYSKLLSKAPFKHESLLVDRKEKKLSKAEKRLAKRSYELEKQANISYSRPSYAAFYPKAGSGQQVMMGTKIGGVVYAKPVGTVRPMQAEAAGGMAHRPNILSRGSSQFPVEALAKQGVSVQQITVPK